VQRSKIPELFEYEFIYSICFIRYICILIKAGKMKIFEFIAIMLALIGGTLMILMGKTPVGYVGVGIFLFGSFLRIIDIIKQHNHKN
jgi:hypothetical protein